VERHEALLLLLLTGICCGTAPVVLVVPEWVCRIAFSALPVCHIQHAH
jgi:hypothetical protein